MNKEELLKSLKQQGFSNFILRGFSKVKREDFVPDYLENRAYEDTALSIGAGQTISQPYTIAEMLSLLELKKGLKVLEIGSGCGYVLALLSLIIGEKGEVFGVEIVKELYEKSKINLEEYQNVKVYNKNGFRGLKEKTPYDRILISAGLKKIPEEILNQLKEGGIIVAPVGEEYEQSLTKIQRVKNNFVTKKEIPGFVFVPFVSIPKK